MNIALTGGMTLKKLITAIIMLTAAVLLLCACTPEQTASVQPTQTQSGQTEQATPSGREFLYDKNGNVIQQPQVRDYTAMWWRDGFNRGGKWQMNMQTGYYGMSVSTLTGTLNTFGAIEQEISESEAGKANNELIDSLAHIRTRFAVIDENGERCGYSGMEAVGGEIKRKYPLSIEAQENGAEVVISGGNGHLPVTVTGLERPFGFTAQVFTNGEWVSVAALRGVSEGECRQCYYNSATGKYELTFALACAYPDTVLRFRLVDSAGE